MTARQNNSTVVFPNGGMCKAFPDNLINDNQSPDMLNMWLKNSRLAQRPGLIKEIEQTYGKILDACPKNGNKLLIQKVVQTDSDGVSNPEPLL